MGPSLNPPSRQKEGAAEPVKTFRPPTAANERTPTTAVRAQTGKAPAKKASTLKVVALVVAFVFLGAAGVAAGLFLTQ